MKVLPMQAEPLSTLSNSPPRLRPRAWALLFLTAVALGLHGWLLGGCWRGLCGQALAAAEVTAMQFRTISSVATHKDAALNAPSVLSEPKPIKPVKVPQRRQPLATEAAPPLRVAAASVLSTEPSFELAALTFAETASEPAPSKPLVQTLPMPSADAATQRVTVPPGFVATYAFRRGSLQGAAELTWAPAGDRYMLRMHVRKGFISVMTQTSEGRLQSTGLEPERLMDSRLGRADQAANFQKDKGLITFSGPDQLYAWQAGTQDRLSWMVQLPAMLAAQPPTLAAGQRFAMTVVGARGEADVWTFEFAGWDEVSTQSGPVRSARLMRETRRPHDQQVEIWLDPEKNYQPVRARWGAAQDPQPVELLRD
jgi:Protein of unknown function (DUF3108)